MYLCGARCCAAIALPRFGILAFHVVTPQRLQRGARGKETGEFQNTNTTQRVSTALFYRAVPPFKQFAYPWLRTAISCYICFRALSALHLFILCTHVYNAQHAQHNT
jgi:hypothetical protein